MTDQDDNIVLEHLKRIQATLATHTKELRELKEGQIAVREEVHALRGDLLRHERAMASLESDIERINARLELRDS